MVSGLMAYFPHWEGGGFKVSLSNCNIFQLRHNQATVRKLGNLYQRYDDRLINLDDHERSLSLDHPNIIALTLEAHQHPRLSSPVSSLIKFFYQQYIVNQIRNGKLSYCSGVNLPTLLVYKVAASLTKMMMENATKPVPKVIDVKKGSKKIQKTALYAMRIKASGCKHPCWIAA